MKIKRQSYAFIITLLLILNCSFLTPNVDAAPPLLPPDQFIGELFPNYSFTLQLIHTNTIITFDALNFSKELGIQFDANYTIYNPENTTTQTFIFHFSLAPNTSKFMYEIYLNNTKIPYDLFTIPSWDENNTNIDRNIKYIDTYPVNFIRTNVTFLKKSSSVIRYQFSGSIINTLNHRNSFFIAYFTGISLDWIGNTTGRIELKVFGEQPVYTYGVPENVFCQRIDIQGGKSFICEWNNIKTQELRFGIRYYRKPSPLEKFIDFIVPILAYFFPIFLIVSGIIIIVLVRRKERKKKEVM
ncbi:MAG: hypothetical protein ACFFB0_19110 [Promethearchaeota archaeon]